MVIRSLSNALVLPWPSKADNEQVRISVTARVLLDILNSVTYRENSDVVQKHNIVNGLNPGVIVDRLA